MSTTVLSAPSALPPGGSTAGGEYVDVDTLRTTFALAMSKMYGAEVPLYSDLVRIVHKVNKDILSEESGSTSLAGQEPIHDSAERLTLERHGAIRLGTPTELHTVRRVFALMGMRPVGYYDLAIAELPMHATCFRPVSDASLEANPFRVFTTLLRPDLIRSSSARELALRLLERRAVFSDALVDLLDKAESHQGSRLTREQADVFVTEAMRSFSWQPVAASTYDDYALLRSEHPILADIACFRSAHINHLTPRALDIDRAQASMIEGGISVKDRIEGPPRRSCPILLRQTSFLALEEKIAFPVGSAGGDDLVEGHHKARFGEIEERGAAVTPKGRALYDRLLADARALAASRAASDDPRAMDEALAETFRSGYPDSWDELREQGLIYCEYRCEAGARERLAALDLDLLSGNEVTGSSVALLVREGILSARPITYEDFLPFSAAGIFQSNLQSAKSSATAREEREAYDGDREGYERAMGCRAFDSEQLYADAQRRSLRECAAELGLDVESVAGLI